MSKTFWWLEFVVLVLLLGLRYNVGGDTLGYTYKYPSSPSLDYLLNHGFVYERRQPLWLLLQALCKLISPSFYFFQFVHAIIVNAVFFWFFKKYCARPFLMVVVFFVLHFAYYNMEIMRQTLSVCCFLLATPYLLKKQYLPYFIWTVIAFGFHVSGVILFLIPLVYDSLTSRNVIITSLVIIGVFILLARTEYLGGIIRYINLLAVLETYNNYSDRYGNMNSVIYDLIFKFSIPFLFLITHRERDRFYTGMASLYVITLGMGATFIYFWRITDFFVIPFYVVLLNELDMTHLSKKNKSLKEWSFIFVILMIIIARWNYYNKDYETLLGVENVHFYDLYVPYHSIFDPVDEPARELIYWRNSGPHE